MKQHGHALTEISESTPAKHEFALQSEDYAFLLALPATVQTLKKFSWNKRQVRSRAKSLCGYVKVIKIDVPPYHCVYVSTELGKSTLLKYIRYSNGGFNEPSNL